MSFFRFFQSIVFYVTGGFLLRFTELCICWHLRDIQSRKSRAMVIYMLIKHKKKNTQQMATI
ncbi:hypothetical protein HanRHA438_Chr12g0548751 [Helianthus annuus]|nr:hypothetical protein HanRHA438_Chr12g0548751 [Helianthus annuus]